MGLYRKYLSLQLKTAFQYRTSLIFNTISSMISGIAVFFGIVLLFQKYQVVAGFTVNEVLITYSITYSSFAFAEMLFRGFDQFDKLVRSGELDRFLIRPRSVFMQVLGYKCEFNKMGRVVFGVGIMIYSLVSANIAWTFVKVLTVVMMFVCSIVIYAGMFLLFSSVSIFTVDGIEFMNIVTNGGRDLAEYPINIYGEFFRKVFTYIIPLGCVNYLPLLFLLDRSGATIFNALCPLFGLVFFVVCLFVFNWALTKYKSTGS